MPFLDEAILRINFFSALVDSFQITRGLRPLVIWKWINLCWEKVDSSNYLIQKRYIVKKFTSFHFETLKKIQVQNLPIQKMIIWHSRINKGCHKNSFTIFIIKQSFKVQVQTYEWVIMILFNIWNEHATVPSVPKSSVEITTSVNEKYTQHTFAMKTFVVSLKMITNQKELRCPNFFRSSHCYLLPEFR